jgi:TRAP-type C4-dicarboxylate transport system substrate-binding protein
LGFDADLLHPESIKRPVSPIAAVLHGEETMLIDRVLKAAAATFLIAQAAQADTTVLTFNKWLPDNNVFHADVSKPWADAVEEATEGRVKIEFTGSSLSPPPRQYDLLRSGAVDLIFSSMGYNPDRFPVSQITSMPYLGETSEATSLAYDDVYNEMLTPANEFRGIKMLGAVAGPPGYLFTSKPVTSIGDYQGMKIRAADPVLSEAVTNLGATPVFGPAPASYELLSTGVIDGGGYFYDAVIDFNIAELVPHVVVVPGGFINGMFYIAMNEDKWSSLSEEDRTAIESVSGRVFSEKAGRAMDARNAVALEKLLAQGLEVHQPDEAFLAELRTRLEPIEAKVLGGAEGHGVDARAAYDALRAKANPAASN